MNNPLIPFALLRMFPSAKPNVDYVVQNDGDGPFIAKWSLPQQQPTEDEIANGIAAVIDQRKSVETVRTALLADFAALPIGVRVFFNPCMTAVHDALTAGDIATAKAIVSTTPVVGDLLTAAQATLISRFP